MVGIPLASLTPPHLHAYPKRGPGLPTSNVMICFMFNDMRSEVIVHFVDIGGFVYLYYLKSFFTRLCLISHLNVEALTALWMILSGTNSQVIERKSLTFNLVVLSRPSGITLINYVIYGTISKICSLFWTQPRGK